MNFLYPQALWGLLLLAVPIAVHLFSFLRSKKVYFPSIQFLQRIKQETSKQSKLKHLLMLLMRCLAVVCLALAFAQPHWGALPTDATQGARLVSIFIDNSLSMQTNGNEGTLLNEAQNAARQVAMGFKPSDKFQVLTHDFDATHQKLLTQAEFLNVVDALKPTAANRPLSAVLRRQSDFLGSQAGGARLRYVVSDFQKNFADLKNCTPQNGLETRLVQVQAPTVQNVYIDTVYFASPILKVGEIAQLLIKTTNSGDAKAENTRAELKINGNTKGILNIDIAPKTSRTDTLTFTPTQNGYNQAQVFIDDAPITFDDDYLFSFFVMPNLPVLVLQNGTDNIYLKTFFATENYFKPQFININNVDYNQLQKFSAIVVADANELSTGLVQELQKALKNGASIVVFAGTNANAASLNTLANSVGMRYSNLTPTALACTQVNLADPIFKDIFTSIPQNLDLPKTNLYYPLQSTTQSTKTNLLTLSSGEPLVAKCTYKSGVLYLCATALNDAFGNLHKHPIFVPMLYRALLLSVPQAPLAYTLGNESYLLLNNTTVKQGALKLTASNAEFAPQTTNIDGKTNVILGKNVQNSGFYALKNSNDTLANIAFNYSRKESDLTYTPDLSSQATTKGYTTIQATQAEKAGAYTRTAAATGWWRWAILATLLWLLCETILDKWQRK